MNIITRLILVSAILLFFIPALTQQDKEAGKPPHLEKQTDPPAPFEALPTHTSPARKWKRGAFVSVQVNVDSLGNNIVGDAANEPSIAVDPTNPDRMVVGWRQFDTIASSFRQAGWAFTTDGGSSWTFPGRIEPGTFRSDPVLEADVDGNFYYNSLDNNFNCTVFRSFDGGATWDGGVFAQGGDKQWMAIDRTSGIGQGNIYSAWNLFFSVCSGDFTRSYDGGDTYLACSSMPGSPSLGTMTVDKDGAVYIAGAFEIVKSSTIQDPFLPAQFDFGQSVSLGGSLASRTGPNPGGLLGQIYVDTDHSNGPSGGNVYMLASVNPPGGDPTDVMFIRSTDGGQNWSTPKKVNDDTVGNNAWQWFGMMAVAPNGRIDAVWNDTRNHPGSFQSELFYAFSSDGGLTWSPNIPLSPAFDPHLGFPVQQKIGDYYDMISDNDGADVIYAATFNGEEDVYYLRIPNPLPPCPADVDGDGNITQDDFDQAVAEWGNPGGPADVDESGLVDIRDLLTIMSSFGPCY